MVEGLNCEVVVIRSLLLMLVMVVVVVYVGFVAKCFLFMGTVVQKGCTAVTLKMTHQTFSELMMIALILMPLELSSEYPGHAAFCISTWIHDTSVPVGGCRHGFLMLPLPPSTYQ